MDFLPQWQVDVYHKTCFSGDVIGPNPIFVPKIYRIGCHFERQIFSKFSLSRSDFDSPCELGSPSQFLNEIWFWCWGRKFSEKLGFVFDHSKRLFVVQIPRVTIYQENVEHIHSTTLYWRCETVEMRGTCLEAQKWIHQQVVSNSNMDTLSRKLYYDTKDKVTINSIQGFFEIGRKEKVFL